MEFNSASLDYFRQHLTRAPSLLIEGLPSSAKALLLKIVQEETKKNILVLTHTSTLLDDAPFFNLQSTFDFPAWETLPSEEIPPSPDIVGKRLQILHHLLTAKTPSVIVTSLQAAVQKVPAPAYFQPLCKVWKVGDTEPFATLPARLHALGYRRSSLVADKGEFAVRGGIIDIFPVSALEPYRIEFFADTIDTIRAFDPTSQKSTAKCPHFFLSPATEESKEQTSLLSYLGKDPLVVFDGLLELEDKWLALGKPSDIFSHQIFFFSSSPIEELSPVQLETKRGRAFYSGKIPLQPLTFECFDSAFKTQRWHMPFTPPTLDAPQPIFICENTSEKKQFPHAAHATFMTGYLSSGFGLIDSPTVLFPLTELTHRPKVRRDKWRASYHTPPSDFHELLPGDLVVHFHQGIGKYLGMEKRPNHQGIETEFLLIEYAEKSRLYVPASHSYLVSRYIGATEKIPTLHTLGSKAWEKSKASAQKQIVGYAQDLIRLNAERAVQGGFSYPPDSPEIAQFEAEFPYPETADQLRAIADTKQDMMSKKAMDRLLCGDVGYGKTEVALRAAFKAVVDGKKQVAILVPTTVLALQHFETFSRRMENYPITICAISRFHTTADVKKILARVGAGSVDILIGTHRLLSKDVAFKDLGLLIIDEEQRFGVRAKEHLKKLKVGVDCLTLTATPIPRTLYLSLLGAKEISVINTPPQDRLPIKTVLSEKNPDLIQTALTRELSRDGQAYFIHNNIASLDLAADEIRKLLPQARIVTGHGQMHADELELSLTAFKEGKADIFVTTTLVENGIDIPNANTILIDRADTFGLADLYQLRGRVGRWNRPAFAYLLTPRLKELPEIARKRLYALLEAQGFGGGMKIAMRDLEIRGAGNILGEEQSGQMAAIGFHFYCQLLKRAIDALKRHESPAFFETKLEFTFDARLPDSYIPEIPLRLEIYHRLGGATSYTDVDAIFDELKDRFGLPPPQVLWLYHLTRLRTAASAKRYTLLKFNPFTLETEQLTAKGSIKKTLLLKSATSPAELEKVVSAML